MMRSHLIPLVAAITLGLTAQGFAQTPPAPTESPAAPATDLSTGETVATEPALGDTYVAEMFGDWAMRCVRTENAQDPCQLYQLLMDQNGNSVAEFSLFPLPEGQQAAAGASIITPLETLLTRQLTLSTDGGSAKRYPFTFCTQLGCVSRIAFLPEEIEAFRKGKEATISIVPAAAPDQEVLLTVSLSGFTAGYNAVREAIAARAEN